MCRVSVSFNQRTTLTVLRVLGSRGLDIMPDANVVEGCRLGVASDNRFFVVGQHNFDMQGPAVAQVWVACSLGAYSGFAEACQRDLVEEGGVVG